MPPVGMDIAFFDICFGDDPFRDGALCGNAVFRDESASLERKGRAEFSEDPADPRALTQISDRTWRNMASTPRGLRLCSRDMRRINPAGFAGDSVAHIKGDNVRAF